MPTDNVPSGAALSENDLNVRSAAFNRLPLAPLPCTCRKATLRDWAIWLRNGDRDPLASASTLATIQPSLRAASASSLSSTVLPTPRNPYRMMLWPLRRWRARARKHVERGDLLVASCQFEWAQPCAWRVRVADGIHSATLTTSMHVYLNEIYDARNPYIPLGRVGNTRPVSLRASSRR